MVSRSIRIMRGPRRIYRTAKRMPSPLEPATLHREPRHRRPANPVVGPKSKQHPARQIERYGQVPGKRFVARRSSRPEVPALPIPAQADRLGLNQRRRQPHRREDHQPACRSGLPLPFDRPGQKPQCKACQHADQQTRDGGAPDPESRERELAGSDGTHRRENRAASNSLEDQRAVGATKAKVVLHCTVDFHVPCGVGAVVQVAIGILVEDVGGGG